MNKAFKYRIYPRMGQEILIHKTFGCVRFVYNRMFANRKVGRRGLIYAGRPDLNRYKRAIAERINREKAPGDLADALSGADVFIGVIWALAPIRHRKSGPMMREPWERWSGETGRSDYY